MRTRNGKAAVALGAAAAGIAAWSTVIEPRLFTVRRASLTMLPEGAAPIRLLHLSDTHLAPWQTDKIRWVRSLAELRPDLVVLTGDLMGHVHARTALKGALQPLADLDVPVAFVHGSNDFYGPILKNPLKYLQAPSRRSTREMDIDNAALTRMFVEELGFIDLNNGARRTRVRGTEVELFGLNDPHIHLDDVDAMRAARNELPAEDSERSVPIGVVHAPYQASLGHLLDAGADLILAGHTHGGQVRLPGVGALTANCDLPTPQARGVSVWYDAHRACFLHVSAGVGGSIYTPMRLCCRPEASLLTLEAATA